MTFKAHIEASIPAANFNAIETFIRDNSRKYCGYQSSHDVANQRFNIVINPLDIDFNIELLKLIKG